MVKLRREATSQLVDGNIVCRTRLCTDEVRNSFCLREVKATISECALRKLSRVGDASTSIYEQLDKTLKDIGRTMARYLNRVFTSIAMRRMEEGYYGLIEKRITIHDAAEAEMPCARVLWNIWAHALHETEGF